MRRTVAGAKGEEETGEGGEWQWRVVAIAQRTSTRQVGYAADTGVLSFLYLCSRF